MTTVRQPLGAQTREPEIPKSTNAVFVAFASIWVPRVLGDSDEP